MTIRVSSNSQLVESVLSKLARTTEEMFTLAELRERLLSGRRLRMKYGVDLTAPDLHLGHAVNLWMFRELQAMGHKVTLLLGDFTTRIGDPTGQMKARPVLPVETIERNGKEILEQARTVLLTDPELLEVRRNSEWLDSMSALELLDLMQSVTLDKLVSREMFRRRKERGGQTFLHELAYPLLQGWDSFVLSSDLTIVGTDQLFNEMMGRELQQRLGQAPQVVITSKITPGLDGKEKQSKSLGNYIGLNDDSRKKFGALMTLPDELIHDYLIVYTDLPIDEVERRTRADSPMERKLLLARKVVERYHGQEEAERQYDWFIRTFRDRKIPDDIPERIVDGETLSLSELVKLVLGPDVSNSEVRRLVSQGGVKIDGIRVGKPEIDIKIPLTGLTVQIGRRRWFRVKRSNLQIDSPVSRMPR